MARPIIPKRNHPSGTRPVMSWTQFVIAMNRARSDDHEWDALRPDAIRYIQRRDLRIDSAKAAQIFDAMRNFTPGLPPASSEDDDD